MAMTVGDFKSAVFGKFINVRDDVSISKLSLNEENGIYRLKITLNDGRWTEILIDSREPVRSDVDINIDYLKQSLKEVKNRLNVIEEQLNYNEKINKENAWLIRGKHANT